MKLSQLRSALGLLGDNCSKIEIGRLLKRIESGNKMKTVLTIVTTLLLSGTTFGQTITSGKYEPSLQLAFNSKTKKLTGYFKESTGWDEATKSPRFSCSFYIEGAVENREFNISTYYPGDKKDDTIAGIIKALDKNRLEIKLQNDHGGCWNVQPFSDKPVEFKLGKKKPWIEIRYVTANKTHFYSKKSPTTKRKAYLVKNDLVYIEKIESNWAYCRYFGKRVTKGWIKISDLNKI